MHPSTEPQASLRVQFAAGRCAEICAISEVLIALDDAYRALFRWVRLIDNAGHAQDACGSVGEEPAKEQSLCLVDIETVAPAQLEVVGIEQPIARLRSYLAERERGAGIESYRNEQIAWLRGDRELLRGAGFSAARIERAVNDLFALFTRLNSHKEIRLLE